MKFLILSVCSVAAFAQTPLPLDAPQQPKKAPAPARKSAAATKPAGLTVDDVCRLAQAQVSDDLIIAQIRKNEKPFDLGVDDILKLKKAGVSDAVIKFMMDPSQAPPVAAPVPAPPPMAASPTAPPAATDAPPMAATPTAASPGAPVPVAPTVDPSQVPAEPGLYYLNEGQLVKVDIKTLASAKAAGRLGHVVTLGVKSVKTDAYLLGGSAKTRVKETAPVFYFRPPEGVGIDELVLATLYTKQDRRELEVAATSGFVGSKQGLRMETMKPYDSKEVGPKLYRLEPSALAKGEYLFYILGSADTIKGIQGKGYDFGVD
ncbi:MAG TPA: hypothetical protein VKU01_00380 [Bryobacteraceae bacterium]|nr:hypothetical protein [Bryobacteraceae bacterium]